jgi:hypothetical protein
MSVLIVCSIYYSYTIIFISSLLGLDTRVLILPVFWVNVREVQLWNSLRIIEMY